MVQINRMILIALVLLTAQVRADGHTGITLTLDNFHRAAATADMDSYFAAMSDDVVFLVLTAVSAGRARTSGFSCSRILPLAVAGPMYRCSAT